MTVYIRPESAKNDVLMSMLQSVTSDMIIKLQNNNILLPNGSIKIWIKEFGKNKLFPKIEFDINNQELQYDISPDGYIQEVHFKTFKKENNSYHRYDIDKMSADPMLIKIDNIIRYI